MWAYILVVNYRSLWHSVLFRFALVLQEAMKVLLNIDSEVDIDATTVSACLVDSMYKPTDATNINQADDNKPFNEYNSDDWNQADYRIVNIDGIQVFIIKKNCIIIICDWIWEKLASTHTTTRHTFHHHMISVNIY